MNTLAHKTFFVALALALTALATSAPAQDDEPKQRRSPFDVPRVSLASLPEVQAELKLNDEQKELANTLQAQLVEDRRSAFEDNSGDWEAIRVEIEKIQSEASEKVVEKLDDGQKSRLTELYVQANGPNALVDKEVMERLKIDEAQAKELETAREDNRYEFFNSMGDLQGLSDEERREAFAELQEEADEHLLKVLSEEQREEFSQLGGAELEYDLAPLMPRGGD